MGLRRELGFFDVTSIVIGSIVGADVYIASALTAGIVGPLAIVAWIVAGLFAIVLALVFAYCSYLVPKVGGPFAFVSAAFDDFFGFLTGWSMWIAEVLSLPVFAIAFVQYLQSFVALDVTQQIMVKGLFLFALTAVNVIGIKSAGRVNDGLTVVKLAPLVLLVGAGLYSFAVNSGAFVANYVPFAPFGAANLGTALVLTFWAYAGFELGTLPASEVKNARNAIPRAIVTGIAVVTTLYLSTNFVVFGTVSWRDLAQTSTPLMLAGTTLLGTAGARIMGTGALISVSGSDESAVLGTARLSYAMSIDGLFPKVFAKVHPKYNTPYGALAIQGVIAFGLSIFSGISGLISFAVLNLAVAYALTCLALAVLRPREAKTLRGARILPWAGIAICGYLIYSTPLVDKGIGFSLILLGIPLYVFYSPKTDIHHLKDLFLSEEAILARRLQRQERFLANFIRLLSEAYRRITRRRARLGPA